MISRAKNIFKKIPFFALPVLLLSSCSPKVYDALEWQSNKVIADGRIPEWNNPLRFYDDKSKINYTFSNDLQNLYACMKISDEGTQVKILSGGLIIRIDTSGKNSFPIEFQFPLGSQQTDPAKKDDEQNKNNSGRPDHSSLKLKLMSQTKDAQLTGFKPPFGGIFSLYNTSSGISAAINIDSLGIMYYEAIIPFKTFYKHELSRADSNKIFSYEVMISGISSSPVHNSRGTAGGGPGGEMESGGMHGGGGMSGGEGVQGGGMNRSGGHDNAGEYGSSEMYSSNKIKNKMRFSIR